MSTSFASRHIGPGESEQAKMLAECGYGSLDALVDAAVPASIRSPQLALPQAATETEATAELRAYAERNTVRTQMIGLGYYDTVTPAVIRRNVLENPAWYTAYTPYQPEISQGRLEALLNFQTMIADLTGLATSNASLLDEPTAVAEAMLLMRRSSKSKARTVIVDDECLPQTVAVLRTRAAALGITVEVRDLAEGLPEDGYFGVIVQYPGASGVLREPEFYSNLGSAAKSAGAYYTVAADLLALTLVRSPGEFGADIAVGTTQRFGVPLGYGGPHAGYMCVRSGLERGLPGRLVGVSVDEDGTQAYRLALQTREQHIRREKATSNICTAQVLPAVLAAMYAVYHGPDGLAEIARRVHASASGLADGLRAAGVDVVHDAFFDTVLARVPGSAEQVLARGRENGINLGFVDADHVRIACDETTGEHTVRTVLEVLGAGSATPQDSAEALPEGLRRGGGYLTHEVFRIHHSETAMMRYLRRLSDMDYALDRGMIPLGSCTMKLNAATEMEPISWPEFAGLHPYAPAEDARGYRELTEQLCGWLAEVTGYDSVSVQPNAGSQGEFAGLLAIREFHKANGQPDRDVCLIPSSAHGTNAASAILAGMRVVVVACTDNGDVDLEALRAKADEHAETLAAIMVTYPSTHGVYEQGIEEIASIVHSAGGQVYVDGANLNALLGLAKPGEFGGDVSHLNLHKTFCIPHGGGGPGVGPVAARAHLAPYLPSDPRGPEGEAKVGPVAGADLGSASILPISWAYMRMMGPDGLTEATKAAVLTANYVAARLAPHYPILYTGRGGVVAHECILDLRELTKRTGVTVDDVAKRLIDYGFHAPTMSFPVAGTFMVEPTESEDLAELDRFCRAMIEIRKEIEDIERERWAVEQSPLRHAPHTAGTLAGDWSVPYDRKLAAYPPGVDPKGKYWPPVRRIDNASGDRNLVCSCPPMSSYEG